MAHFHHQGTVSLSRHINSLYPQHCALMISLSLALVSAIFLALRIPCSRSTSRAAIFLSFCSSFLLAVSTLSLLSFSCSLLFSWHLKGVGGDAIQADEDGDMDDGEKRQKVQVMKYPLPFLFCFLAKPSPLVPLHNVTDHRYWSII